MLGLAECLGEIGCCVYYCIGGRGAVGTCVSFLQSRIRPKNESPGTQLPLAILVQYLLPHSICLKCGLALYNTDSKAHTPSKPVRKRQLGTIESS